MMVATIVMTLAPPFVRGQSRMSDKDIEETMQNLKNDAKNFESSFNSAIGKSTLRKTSQEKDAKALVKTFAQETNSMHSVFKSSKKTDTSLPGVLGNAQKIDKLLADVPLGENVTSRWSRVKSELNTLASAFNMPALP
jgi:hypothetical protein